MFSFFKKSKKKKSQKKTLSPMEYERMAESYLRDKGYKISERNFRLRSGEIDLVAQQANEIVFVEVRKRSNSNFGSPEESVDREKQARLRKMAENYLNSRYMSGNFQPRFDVVAIMHQEGEEPRINHITDAF